MPDLYSQLRLPEPYDDQVKCIDQLRAGIGRGAKGQVLVAPPGFGKTVVAQHMIAGAVRKGTRGLFVVDRLSLLEQTSRRFHEAGIEHGIYGGGDMNRGWYEPIRVAMAQTIAKRGWPGADFIVVDECHFMYDYITQTLPEQGCPYIGLTATPFARGMGKLYPGGLVQSTTTNKLLAEGRLSPLRIKSAIEIDMTDATKVAGEWTARDVQSRGRRIIGDIVSTYVEETNRHFEGPVKTMVFAASIAHGDELCTAFQEVGLDFRQVSAYDDPEQRNRTMAAFRHGDFPGIVSCEVLSKGVDIPDLLCLVIARPYVKAFAAHIQMLGRAMRVAQGKEYALVLDHAGNCIEASQRVLTHRGEIAICNVRDDDLLWDGVEWVSHGGAICNGSKGIMTYAGITATPDHQVWTRRGWLPLRAAARTLEPIAETGFAGAPVRIGADCVRHDRTPWARLQPEAACALRMRDLRLSLDPLLTQLADWAHRWVQGLQPTTAAVPEMALGPMFANETAVSEPARSRVCELWGAGRRVPLANTKDSLHVDHRELGPTRRQGVGGTGPDRQRWPLRAREPAVGAACGEHQQPARVRDDAKDARLQDSAPRGALRRFHALQIHLAGFVGRRNNYAVAPPVEKAKGEVWDILDAGPRNRFTCEGLLVHNCLGFYHETAALFENGVDKLDDGKFQKVKRAEKKPTDATCSGCDFVMPPGAKVCPVCGKERKRRSDLEIVPGQMIEIDAISKGKRGWKGTDDELWAACCSAAGRWLHQHGDVARAQRQAKAHFHELSGGWPADRFKFVPGGTVPKAIQRKIDQNYRAWKKAQAERKASNG